MNPARQGCPICGRPASQKDGWFPFCSTRCRTQDLANWATGTYSIPVRATEADEHLDATNPSEETEADE